MNKENIPNANKKCRRRQTKVDPKRDQVKHFEDVFAIIAKRVEDMTPTDDYQELALVELENLQQLLVHHGLKGHVRGLRGYQQLSGDARDCIDKLLDDIEQKGLGTLSLT